MARVVSQSNTEWVKKGTVVNGKAVSKGYLAQKGKPAKKVTARVQMEQQTGGVARGDTQMYAKGRRKTEMMGSVSSKKKPVGNGGGNGGGNGTGNGSRNGAGAQPLTPSQRKAAVTKAANSSVGRASAAELARRKAAGMPALSYRKPGAATSPTSSSGAGSGGRGAGSGGRGAGPGSIGPGGTPLQQKIRNAESVIASQRAALERQRKRANQTAAQKQQADRDAATLKNLEKTLSDLKNQARG